MPIANFRAPRGIVAEVHRVGAPETRLPRGVHLWWGL